MKRRIIGDVHGKWRSYKNIIDNSPHPTIQVGDFGVGFGQFEYHDEPMSDYLNEQGNRHRFIRGNHDNPAVCKQFPQYIEDGTVEDNMMFVGGAWSIDHHFRTQGHDWWEDEELSIPDLERLVETYSVVRPEIMITHDCPQSVSTEFFIKKGLGMGDNHTVFKTRTAQALDVMFELHQPKLWLFGHWHTNLAVMWHNTLFICIAELDWIDVDTENCDVEHHRFWRSKV